MTAAALMLRLLDREPEALASALNVPTTDRGVLIERLGMAFEVELRGGTHLDWLECSLCGGDDDTGTIKHEPACPFKLRPDLQGVPDDD